MKRLLHSISLLMVVSVSAHAGWIEDRADGTTIVHLKLFDIPDPSDPSVNNRAECEVVKRFRERFPKIFAERWAKTAKERPDLYGKHNWDDVKVELHKATGITVSGVESDLLQIAGGIAPDVMYINFRKSDTYIRNHFLHPLDEYVKQLPDEEYALRVHPKVEPVIYRKGPNGEKHWWAFPFGGALGRVLLYRKDLFDRHDIPYPDNDWTWEDMYEAARKITNPQEGIYGLRLCGGGWFWLTWLWSMGGDVMAYDEAKDQWTCVFGSREAAIALDYYTQLAAEKWIDQEGKIRRGYSNIEIDEDSFSKWNRGEIGMMIQYIDERTFTVIDPEVTGMAPVPLGYPDEKTGVRRRGGELNSRMMGMFSQIKEKAVRDAAWEYMRFTDSEEALRIRTKIMVEGGLGRFLNPKYLRMFGYPEIERLSPKGWTETFRIAIESGHPEPYGTNSNLAYRMMETPVDTAISLRMKDKLPKDREERVQTLHKLLKEAENLANEQMIGIISPRQRLTRRVCAAFLILGIVIGFGLVGRRIIQAFTPPQDHRANKGGWQFKRHFWAYLLLLPALATIIVWNYVPLFRGSLMAFMDYKLIGKSQFVWLDNFGNLLFEREWWESVWNALRYSFLVLGMSFVPPIILAIALQEVPRMKLAFRLIYYLPAVITGIVTVLLWKQFYQPSDRGALNMLVMRIPAIGFILVGLLLLGICLAFAKRLRINDMRLGMWLFVIAGVLMFCGAAGLATPILWPAGETFATAVTHLPMRLLATLREPRRWLNDPETAMLGCVIPMIWAGMGPGCLIYLAALKGIPDDYYEAADIDGATFIDKILFIVFPMLKALIIINFIGAFINSWYSATGNILVMTGGFANTETAGLHIWHKAFTFLKFGPATAAAWMLGFMLIGFTVHQLRILSKVEFKAAGGRE